MNALTFDRSCLSRDFLSLDLKQVNWGVEMELDLSEYITFCFMILALLGLALSECLLFLV